MLVCEEMDDISDGTKDMIPENTILEDSIRELRELHNSAVAKEMDENGRSKGIAEVVADNTILEDDSIHNNKSIVEEIRELDDTATEVIMLVDDLEQGSINSLILGDACEELQSITIDLVYNCAAQIDGASSGENCDLRDQS